MKLHIKAVNNQICLHYWIYIFAVFRLFARSTVFEPLRLYMGDCLFYLFKFFQQNYFHKKYVIE
jgi:hypothetical protein